MEFWPEFLASSCGREFIAGGFGGMTGVISGHPLDTLRIRLQQPSNKISALQLLRNIIKFEGLSSLYRGMGTPLASVTFQVIYHCLWSLLFQLQQLTITCYLISFAFMAIDWTWTFMKYNFLNTTRAHGRRIDARTCLLSVPEFVMGNTCYYGCDLWCKLEQVLWIWKCNTTWITLGGFCQKKRKRK